MKSRRKFNKKLLFFFSPKVVSTRQYTSFDPQAKSMRSTHASIRYPNKEGKPFDEMDELDWKRDFNLSDKMYQKM